MRTLDVRGLVPCEPFERALEALDALASGERLTLLISREPFPLYDWLREHGFRWTTLPPETGQTHFTLQIQAPVQEG
ncbi:MAG: hypothetical protein CGU28_07645 [Candidatus Dactylopiibacterium carminicum]|uniref:DUF2249 domain-containing protein n=1 Tax=Candidatus Dactylopiibacterium carminicum TaxID=857335 RepID=A0A272EVM2_9RHOO|nr:DUF2249 domain-containing protein [Candidatus Dactylopiibacterium carminicum]KAF7599906.1 DUF2249 domain-containing protein [Candidatus Dactylopiibacterium carminicum]PAS94155.1 MAG: hypothetical protein CGU29_04830 [Candidatus Dactylopiibacterium carminicum]PAS96775.1 MAG: hypothetical protein CGU28_07645 [Candidatus Dactylopiibacterium carminicum]PAS99908.1 MAG: hypothetical protein BSR46_05545 [Candidatus Dactylopiibacterium carminicum]